MSICFPPFASRAPRILSQRRRWVLQTELEANSNFAKGFNAVQYAIPKTRMFCFPGLSQTVIATAVTATAVA